MLPFKKANLKVPSFVVEQGGFTTLIPREIFMAINGVGNTDTKPIQTELKPSQNRVKTELKNQLIEILKANPTLSYVELGKIIGMHRSSVQRRLDALVKEGKIKHNGPASG